ncbi:MAG: FHA domain-containing protein [Myxococcaceae bacterium]|nr:FHA domain-containing protein [Myxococcaceae bacterium]
MHVEFALGHEVEVAELADGTFTAGGGEGDALHFPGLPKALATLEVRGERLFVTASDSLAVGKSVLPRQVRRLVGPGEVIRLGRGAMVRQVPARQGDAQSTACVLQALCSQEPKVLTGRAASLTCLTGEDQGLTWVLATQETVIGRGDGCAVRVRDRSVSRRHLRLIQLKGRFFAAPVVGTNGLFINGKMVTRSTPLRGGDVLELGLTLLRFDAPGSAPSKAEDATIIVAPEVSEAKRAPLRRPRVPASSRRAPRFELVAVAVGVTCAAFGFAVTLALLG